MLSDVSELVGDCLPLDVASSERHLLKCREELQSDVSELLGDSLPLEVAKPEMSDSDSLENCGPRFLEFFFAKLTTSGIRSISLANSS